MQPSVLTAMFKSQNCVHYADAVIACRWIWLAINFLGKRICVFCI